MLNTFADFITKHLKTDGHYLVKGGLWLSLGRGFTLLSGLVLTIAMANLLSKEAYGTYQFIIAVSAIAGTFTLSKMDKVIVRAVARGKESALRSGFNTQLHWSIGIIIVSSVVSLYYWTQDDKLLAYTFMTIGLLSPLLVGFQLANSYLIGKQLFKESALLGFWRKPIPVIALLVTLAFTYNPLVLAIVYFASNTLMSGLVYLLVVKKYKLPRLPEVNLVNLSKHLSFIAIVRIIGNNLDKLLVFYFLGPVSVAAYTLAHMPIKMVEGLYSSLYQMSLPKISQRGFEELQKLLPPKVKIAFLVTLGIVVLYIATIPFFFRLAFPTYPEAILYSQALALLLLSKPRGFYLMAFLAHGMKRRIYLSNLSLPILTIILLLFLLPLYGIWGAIFALLIAHLCVNVILFFTFRYAKTPLQQNLVQKNI